MSSAGHAAPPRDPEREARQLLAVAVAGACAAFWPPAALAVPVAAALKPERRRLAWAAAAGLCLVALFWLAGLVEATWLAAWRQAGDSPGLLRDASAFFAALTPQLFYGWLVFLPATPAVALAGELLRDKRPGEHEQRAERAWQRRERRLERRAGRRAESSDELTARAGADAGVILGQKIAGERALPTKRRTVVLPFDQLRYGVLCAGAPGSGKSESALRVCWALAQAVPEALVAYIDGKGDRQAAERFCGLMADAGRRARVWPNEPYAGFRGDPWAVYYRLLELGQYPTEGDGFHYRTLATSALRLAVAEHPDGPPTSAGGLLERLDLEALKAAHGPAVEVELTGAQVRDVRRRYAGIFGPLRGGADGDWAFEDADAAYVLIERQRMGEQAPAAARFFFEDFGHFFTSRKQRERPVLLVVDELTALAERGGLASRIEQARGFNTSLFLCPQSAAGMGPEAEARRIRDAVGLMILHQLNDPELLAQAAGTRMGLEYSQHYQHGLATREGSARLQHQAAIDLNEARSLRAGVAFLIRRGQRMKAKLARAPELRAELPSPMPWASANGHDGRAEPQAAAVRKLRY